MNQGAGILRRFSNSGQFHLLKRIFCLVRWSIQDLPEGLTDPDQLVLLAPPDCVIACLVRPRRVEQESRPGLRTSRITPCAPMSPLRRSMPPLKDLTQAKSNRLCDLATGQPVLFETSDMQLKELHEQCVASLSAFHRCKWTKKSLCDKLGRHHVRTPKLVVT